jgi:hypothetical protein
MANWICNHFVRCQNKLNKLLAAWFVMRLQKKTEFIYKQRAPLHHQQRMQSCMLKIIPQLRQKGFLRAHSVASCTVYFCQIREFSTRVLGKMFRCASGKRAKLDYFLVKKEQLSWAHCPRSTGKVKRAARQLGHLETESDSLLPGTCRRN